ncbi:putative tRNA pseudouridine synthase A [Magnetofaba australis IT-1]|uniref:tRNA pseudouridine synthase A n=1 Tax=Magnetofaba australis IT-1 TaxID=1434232 RepID=A0A1Y2K5U6_9PROT|nr:putative tRNA pseudouridine synthase A [Magnetofaba australis IT-1]
MLVEYDGAAFHGWQRQKGQASVQQAIEEALEPLCGGPVTLHGAGRTDAGVHASGQVAHFDSPRARLPGAFRQALNVNTPHTLTIRSCMAADDDFHSRFHAYYREYLYRIHTRFTYPALLHNHIWHHPKPLDVAAMNAAAEHLLGKRDFSAFRAAACQADDPVKILSLAEVSQAGEEIHLRIGANAFLHHMVRNIVGSLALVGRGEWTSERFAEVLAAGDRTQAGPTAPAGG